MLATQVIERLQELGLSSEIIALAQGVLLGDKSHIASDIVRDFRNAGMSHLLAVSGLHVGIIMSVIWLLLKPLEAIVDICSSQRLRNYYLMETFKRLVVIIFTVGYVCMIGAPVSAVRASLMLILCLIAWMFHRPSSTWNCLILAALILIALDPWCVFDVGFQLSFLAVAGIWVFQPWLQEHRFFWWERLFLFSLSAQWFTLPLVAYYFHQVPFFGWLQGLLVVPLMPFFVGGLLLGCAFPSLHLLCQPLDMLYSWIIGVSHFIQLLEQWCLGGHLYFYPSVIEVLLSEFVLLAVVLCLRMCSLSNKKTEI